MDRFRYRIVANGPSGSHVKAVIHAEERNPERDLNVLLQAQKMARERPDLKSWTWQVTVEPVSPREVIATIRPETIWPEKEQDSE